MELNIQITGFNIEVTPVIRNDNIKGFANWIFITNTGEIKLKNGTIREKEFGSKKLLTFDVPAIKGRFKYNKVFFIDNKELYRQLCDATIKKYCEQTGELPNNLVDGSEEVNIDDIPL